MKPTEPEWRQAEDDPCVMIVDDEESIREAVRELLESENIAVLTASCCAECLRLLQDGFRGVILMDVMMNGPDGWSTIRSIEKAGLMEGNLIVMLTANDAPDDRANGLQECVVDYILKPFDPYNIVSSVRKYLALLGHTECSGVL